MSEKTNAGKAKISAATERFARIKAKNDPSFDFEGFIANAEKEAQERADVLNEMAPALMKKFHLNENTIEALLRESPYMPDLLKAGISFSAADARRLANELLSDEPLALAIIEQRQKAQTVRDEFLAIGAKEIRRLMSEAGLDPATFREDAPFRNEWSEFYWAAQETQAYKDALANTIIQTERYEDAFRKWLTQDKELSAESFTARELVETAAEFPLHTSQEMYAFHCAQADGKTFNGYQRNEQAGAIVHQRAGSSHLIRVALTDDEHAAGLTLDYLVDLVRSQDADAVLATEYILRVLAPPPPLTARPYAGGWIDFDDVLKKIGWYPQTTIDRREMHAKIWDFVKFGERAHIVGKRTGAKYTDAEGNEIDTTIYGAAWRVMKTETPDQPALYGALETPVRAEIVVSKEITTLISNRHTAQYLQCGEVLGAIPGGKPAGAWARVIGLALLSFWRRKPHEHKAGALKPTRRELLNRYAAKLAPYEEILASDKPGRAIDYWCGALQILADSEFIERTGEAALSAKEIKSGLPRKGWQDTWLDQTVTIEIGAKPKPAFEQVLKSLHAPKPRNLKNKPRAKKRPKTQ